MSLGACVYEQLNVSGSGVYVPLNVSKSGVYEQLNVSESDVYVSLNVSGCCYLSEQFITLLPICQPPGDTKIPHKPS